MKDSKPQLIHFFNAKLYDCTLFYNAKSKKWGVNFINLVTHSETYTDFNTFEQAFNTCITECIDGEDIKP